MNPKLHVEHARLVKVEGSRSRSALGGAVRVERITTQSHQPGTLWMHSLGTILLSWHVSQLHPMVWKPLTPLLIHEHNVSFYWTGPLCFVQVDMGHGDGWSSYQLRADAEEEWEREPLKRPSAKVV